MKQVILGDCLSVLKTWPGDSIDLVYLDPPFFTQKTHSLKTKDLKEEYQFIDKWANIQEYKDFLRQRLIEIKRVMNSGACIFFHCDRTASHHIRLLLDEIFGPNRFLSEIIWTYRRWSNSKKSLLNSHQTIHMYSKTEKYTFNQLMQDYSETTNLDQILQKRERNAAGKTIYARSDDGEVILNGAKKGVPLSDTWAIPYLNPKARERTGYPTQKPLLLLEKIIQLASNPGDVVLDPFCGSGSTLVAASLLNRNYVGIDISEKAVELTKTRLANPIKTQSHLLQKGRTAYDNLPNPVKTILSTLPVKIVQRNSGVDAIHNEFVEGTPVAIRVQRENEVLLEAANKLAKSGKRMRSQVMILIQTSPDPKTLFPEILPEQVTVIKSTRISLEEAILNQIHQVQENTEKL